MKILIINHEFPPVGGGGATASAEISKHLAGFGNDVTVLTGSYKGLPKENLLNNCKILRIKSFRRDVHTGSIQDYLFFTLNSIFFSIKNINKTSFDKVFAFFTIPSGLTALFIKKIHNIPYIVFLRGIDVPGFYGGKFSVLNKLLKPLIKYIWVNAEYIVANSHSLKELALKTLDKRPIYVIPNGVDGLFQPVSERKKEGIVKLIYIGRLSKQKNLDNLLLAVSLAKKDTANCFTLEIIGEGPEKKSLVNRCSELGISDIVLFSGWVERDKIPQIYNRSDIFVSVSLDEGMSNSLLEAMASGLPVVVSNITAHRELVESGVNGYLIDVNDVRSLSRAINELVTDEALRLKLGKNNLDKVKKHNWRTIADSLCRLVKGERL